MKNFKKFTAIGFSLLGILSSEVTKAQSDFTPTESINFRVFPNPVETENNTYVSLKGFEANDLLVVVYDMLGREIYSKVEMIENGGFLFTLTSDGTRLPSGVYLITASADDVVFKQKLIVK